MLKALNTASTGMSAQQTNMDVVANNIANVNTAGFKKSRAEFEDLLYKNIKEPGEASGLNSVSPTGVQVGLGVRTAATQRDMSLGNAQVTQNALDVQIEGSGFFQVLTPDGQVAFTRDGQFKKDPTGRIIDRNGNVLQPEIRIPQDAVGVEIAPSGEVRVLQQGQNEAQQIGQIDIVTFINPAGLRAVGKNLFLASNSSGQPVATRPGLQGAGALAQGQVESSNVNVAEEMINMIRAQRAFEMNSKAVQAADQMLQSINNLR